MSKKKEKESLHEDYLEIVTLFGSHLKRKMKAGDKRGVVAGKKARRHFWKTSTIRSGIVRSVPFISYEIIWSLVRVILMQN